MMGFLAEQAGKGWDQMDATLRDRFLAPRGFTAADWDRIRAGRLHTDAELGGTFLVPDDLRHRADLGAAEGERLATRLMAAIVEETEFAVPSVSIRGQAMVLGNNRPGTIAGEVLRSGLMFKSFALSIALNHLKRTFTFPTRAGRFGYFVAFAALTTVMGAFSLQLKEIAKGRDPQPMDNKRFLAAAFMQGGGLGIFGDFLAQSENRFGGGFAQTLAGPVVGLAQDVGALVGGNLWQSWTGETSNAGRELTKFLRQNTPGASLWQVSLVFQRAVFDEIQRALDPEAEVAWRRAERRRMQNFGNAAWAPPGGGLPERGPDFGNILGGGG